MDLVGGWSLLPEGQYVTTARKGETVVREKATDRELHVLRDENNQVIYARGVEGQTGRNLYEPTDVETGHPVLIKPVVFTDEQGKQRELGDAGKGTAWTIKRLIDLGYFDRR